MRREHPDSTPTGRRRVLRLLVAALATTGCSVLDVAEVCRCASEDLRVDPTGEAHGFDPDSDQSHCGDWRRAQTTANGSRRAWCPRCWPVAQLPPLPGRGVGFGRRSAPAFRRRGVRHRAG